MSTDSVTVVSPKTTGAAITRDSAREGEASATDSEIIEDRVTAVSVASTVATEVTATRATIHLAASQVGGAASATDSVVVEERATRASVDSIVEAKVTATGVTTNLATGQFGGAASASNSVVIEN